MEAANPSGLCECGCGQRTSLAPHTHSARGWVKGQPVRYVAGHQSKGNRYRVGKPPANAFEEGQRAPRFLYGYYFHAGMNRWIINGRGNAKIPFYRAVMEAHLGRRLESSEVVHHINGDSTDDRIENLELMQGQSEHARLHGLGREIRG